LSSFSKLDKFENALNSIQFFIFTVGNLSSQKHFLHRAIVKNIQTSNGEACLTVTLTQTLTTH